MENIRVFRLLVLIAFLGCPCVQAKWVEIPYTGQFTLKEAKFDIGSKKNIWAVAHKRVKEGAKKDFYLVKWNARKKKWDEHVLLGKIDNILDVSMTAAPDGSVFVLEPRVLIKKSRAQLDDAIAKSVALAGKIELEKLVKEGLVDKHLLDVLDRDIKKHGLGYPTWANFIFSQEFQSQKKDVKDQIIKMAANVKREVISIFRRPTQPLLRFADGTPKVIEDLGGEKVKILGIAAIDKNQLLLLKGKSEFVKNKNGQKEIRFKTWVEKWNGSSFERMGNEVEKVNHIFVGSDGFPYLAGIKTALHLGPKKGEVLSEKTEVSLLKWDGSEWRPSTIELKKYVGRMWVVNDKEIWFTVPRPAWTEFYRWNGVALEQKGMIKPKKVGAEIKAAPGIVLAKTNSDGKLYKWVERAKMKVGMEPFVPTVFPIKR